MREDLAGLVLEGVCGVGKTTLFNELLRSPQVLSLAFPSRIALSEHHTQRVLEKKERDEGLTLHDNLTLLGRHVAYLESLRDSLARMPWRENGRTNMRILCLLERFHWTHAVHYDHVQWSDVIGVDSRLAGMKFKCCLLTMDDALFQHRILDDRGPGWRDYVSRYGNSDEQILAYYRNQQKQFLDMCDQSLMETRVINTTHRGVMDVVAEVASFWLS